MNSGQHAFFWVTVQDGQESLGYLPMGAEGLDYKPVTLRS